VTEMLSAQVLVLNSAYLPINAVSWKKAIGWIFEGKAETIYEKDTWIKSPSTKIKLPSVVRLRNVSIIPVVDLKCNKKNVFLRDNYTCQYCNQKIQKSKITIDHVYPRRKGGKTTWENVVAACPDCNVRKADRTPSEAGMKLAKRPKKPYYYPYLIIRKMGGQKDLEVWKEFFVM